MSSLGAQTAFHLFASQEDFSAQFICIDDKADDSVTPCEIMAVSSAFELDIIELAKFLHKRGIEIFAENRKGPLVVAGGALTLINPALLAPIADLIIIGDGEMLIPRFAEIYRDYRILGKERLLQACSAEPGFWAPGYNELGTVHPVVGKRSQVLHSVITGDSGHFGDSFLVEVGRGCPRGCKFCVSGYMHAYEYHPAGKILDTIEKFASPGSKIGLIGSALSDYPELEYLMAELIDRDYKLATSSLRADIITPSAAALLAKGGVNTITIAPEAGTLRLRKISGKGMTDNLILQAAKNGAEAGIEKLKLYFMIGIPGETPEDIQAIADLTNRILEYYPPSKLELSVNGFIPKPGTVWANAPFAGDKYLRKTRKILRQLLPNVNFTRRVGKEEAVQALLAKGDETTARDYLKESMR